MNDVKVLLLSASQWDFIDEKTNEQRKGTTIFVCHLTDKSKENLVGIKPVKYSMEYDDFNIFKNQILPAYALGQFDMDFGSGKPKPYDFTNISALEVGAVSGSAK